MTGRCRQCRRLLKDPEYAQRGTGRVCGGPIRKGRRQAQPSDLRCRRRAPDDCGEQEALFEMEDQ